MLTFNAPNPHIHFMFPLGYCLNRVTNYRRGTDDFFGVILLKRRRIAGEVSTLWACYGRGMGGEARFWTIYTYVFNYKHMYTDYIYICSISKRSQ